MKNIKINQKISDRKIILANLVLDVKFIEIIIDGKKVYSSDYSDGSDACCFDNPLQITYDAAAKAITTTALEIEKAKNQAPPGVDWEEWALAPKCQIKEIKCFYQANGKCMIDPDKTKCQFKV